MKNNSFGRAGAMCRASIGSVTIAQKARKLLSASDIRVSIVKISSRGAGGCVYGIEYPCELSGNVMKLLQNGGIRII